MEKMQVLSIRQLSGWMIMFAISEAIASACPPINGTGTWLAIVFAGLFTYFMLFIYSYIMSHFPEKDIYDVFKIVFGNTLSKLATIVFIVFSLYVAYFALKIIVSFTNLISLIDTPIFFVGSLIVFWAAYTLIAEGGVEAAGRTVLIVLPVILIVFFGFIILLLPEMDFDNLLPLVSVPFKDVLHNAHMHFTNSGGDLVLFMGFLINPIKKNSRIKAFTIVNFVGMIILLTNSIFITSLLGIHIYYETVFPAFGAFSLFYYGNFISRMELIISLMLLICFVSKIAAGLYVSSRGCKSLFKTKSYKKWVAPLSVIILFFASFSHNTSNHLEINGQLHLVKNIVQVGLPLILVIILLIRKPKLISYGLITE